MTEKVDPFHYCALAAGSIANDIGRMKDIEFVRKLAYAMYDSTRKVINDDKRSDIL